MNIEVITTPIDQAPPHHRFTVDSEQFRDLINHLKIMGAFGESLINSEHADKNISDNRLPHHEEEFFLSHLRQSRTVERDYFFKTMCVQLSVKLQPWRERPAMSFPR